MQGLHSHVPHTSGPTTYLLPLAADLPLVQQHSARHPQLEGRDLGAKGHAELLALHDFFVLLPLLDQLLLRAEREQGCKGWGSGGWRIKGKVLNLSLFLHGQDYSYVGLRNSFIWLVVDTINLAGGGQNCRGCGTRHEGLIMWLSWYEGLKWG